MITDPFSRLYYAKFDIEGKEFTIKRNIFFNLMEDACHNMVKVFDSKYSDDGKSLCYTLQPIKENIIQAFGDDDLEIKVAIILDDYVYGLNKVLSESVEEFPDELIGSSLEVMKILVGEFLSYTLISDSDGIRPTNKGFIAYIQK